MFSGLHDASFYYIFHYFQRWAHTHTHVKDWWYNVPSISKLDKVLKHVKQIGYTRPDTSFNWGLIKLNIVSQIWALCKQLCRVRFFFKEFYLWLRIIHLIIYFISPLKFYYLFHMFAILFLIWVSCQQVLFMTFHVFSFSACCFCVHKIGSC